MRWEEFRRLAVRVGQLKTLGMPTDSLDDAVLWRKNRITHSNRPAGARTKASLELPGCNGSWFSVKFRHLRYSDWDRVLPVCVHGHEEEAAD
jgi:hypothetical protein